MFLDAVNNKTINNFDMSNHFGGAAASVAPTKNVFDKWRNFPASRISHHGSTCCEIAREWLNAMDYSNLNGDSPLTGPRWIRQRYDWGPTRWQIHWCEAVRQTALDCGAQAALASEVFTARGVKSYAVQLVQEFSSDATRQWSHRWSAAETSEHWIDENLIYHEGCAVETGNGNEVKLWDASAAWWTNPKQTGGYGGLRAVRLFAAGGDRADFKWGERRIAPNCWQEV